MTFKDMISMSFGNLWNRKMRTALTVMGVLIGTASIIAMLSVAMGMKKMILDQFAGYGTITQISVSEGVANGTAGDKLKLTEDNIKMFQKLDHVISVEPLLAVDMNMEQGKYESYASLQGVSEEKLKSIQLDKGRLPKGSSNMLEGIAGNTMITNFYEAGNENSGYYMTGEILPVDYFKSSMHYLVTVQNTSNQQATAEQSDASATNSNEENSLDGSDTGSNTELSQNVASSETGETQVNLRIKCSGVMKGGPEDYSDNSEAFLVNIDDLKAYLKKNFKKGQIPGQPMKSNGQPFSDWVYSSLTINADSAESVDSIVDNINNLGFQAFSNKEFLESAQTTTNIIELVLGAIGMIAFLVAAIGIANTMMMSTYERTKEIGIMKVLGCDMHDIQKLFLCEAGLIGFIGGCLGLAITGAMSFLANSVVAQHPEMFGTSSTVTPQISIIPWWLALAGIAFATVMGMLAGFFPARRAMKLSALAAIHTE